MRIHLEPFKPAAILLAVGLIFSGAQVADAAQAPGSAPPGTGNGQAASPSRTGIEAASGLKVFYRVYGKYSISVDAAGSNGTSHRVSVHKPHKNAKVEKAYLLASSSNTRTIANGDITLNNNPVTWSAGVFNDIPPSFLNFFHSVLADVTSIVKARMDPINKSGRVKFTLKELIANTNIDGEILVVVFKNAALKNKRTIALLFGGQQLAGDRFEIALSKGIDPAGRNSVANMGLGISYSYQGGGTQQFSIVDVNAQRLSTAAGGEDDGSGANGALITAGGLGDKNTNPSKPNATPKKPRSDDELYSLLPLITKNTKTIYVDTSNPSNDDNIFFAWFELSSDSEINKDTDGDGLLDSWEKKGYDHDGDGTIDVPIHKRGANWRRKDIFIAYAWMQKSGSESKSHKPSKQVLAAVKKAFARAPVSNPGKGKGINVHFLDKGGVPHDDDLNPVWTEFDAIMNPLVSEAERKIYHRMLNGHAYSNSSSSGLSRGIPASDFIETLGRWSSNPGTFMQRAGTIMHELGHNLGLRHGGVDHENYKPNHLSIMSYFNQVVWLIKNNKPLLDYERYDLKPLDETALDERKGLDRVGNDKRIRKYGVRYYSCGASSTSKNTAAHRNVDWNNNGNATDNPIVCNLNNMNGTTTLNANYPEWDNIVYDGGDVGPGLPANELNMVTSADDLVELTYEMFLEMQDSVEEAR